MSLFNEFKLNEQGLLPVITQDYKSKKVLMQAYMNEVAFEKTLESNQAYYYSRSRNSLWKKGETSGHFQEVKKIYLDCDKDCLLIEVNQTGVACHTGEYSCFYREIVRKGENNMLKEVKQGEELLDEKILKKVYNVIVDRKNNPKEGSYTNYLFEKGIDKMLKKVGEESAEVIIASKNTDKKEVVYEISDLIYHLMVVMVEKGVTWEEIYKELTQRN